MGLEWDATGVAFDPKTWERVYDVLKPGAHLLAFGGTRTFHRMATAIEAAGFEIRDCLMWVYACLSEDTRVLTRRGWLRHDEIETDDEVLQWNPASEILSWARPSQVHVYDYDGPLVHLKNRNTDQLLTPNHRVYAEVKGDISSARPPISGWRVFEAGRLKRGYRIRLPLAAPLREGVEVDPDYAYLVGWWLTDAWLHEDGKAVMFSQAKPVTLARLRTALAPNGYSEYVKTRKLPQRDEHTFYVVGPLAKRLRSEYPTRELGWEVLAWDFEARRRLYDGLMDGDGSYGRMGDHTFWSRDPRRREIFMALALSLGYRALEGVKGCVHVCPNRNSTAIVSKHRRDPVQYSGKVWCVTVPTGAFVAMRNGRPFITGNSGFPKSHNVSKAIDDRLGVEREVIGPHPNPASTNRVQTMGRPEHSGSGWQDVPMLTAPGSPEATEWDGWGTALKPAWEPILLARKPLRKGHTVAQAVLAHGTGALNIDGCRVVRSEEDVPGWHQSGARGSDGFQGETFQIHDMSPEEIQARCGGKGRWPANLLLSHDERCVQVGTRRVKGCPAEVIQGGKAGGGFDVGSSDGTRRTVFQGYGDAEGMEEVEEWACVPGCPLRILDAQAPKNEGGLSRLFSNCSFSDEESAFAKARMLAETWSCEFANTVGNNSSLPNHHVASALNRVVTLLTQGGMQLSDLEVPGTRVTPNELRLLVESVIALTLFTAKNALLNRKPGAPTRYRSHVSGVEIQVQTATTTTITARLTSGGCVANVTFEGTLSNTGLGAAVSPSRVMYCPKASKSERRLGIDPAEFPKGNGHPTVKPIALMRWLVRLVCPPRGLCLDPFAGSGTTGVAALMEGFRFLGVEGEVDHHAVMRARLAWVEREAI